MLQNKRVVIIHSTPGMGLSAILSFVEEGAKVVVVDRNPENSESAVSKLKENGIVFTADAKNSIESYLI